MTAATLINNGRGFLAQARGDITTAMPLAKRAFERAMQLGVHRYRTDAADLLSSLYESQGNAAEALRYQKLFHGLKDSAISDAVRAKLLQRKRSISIPVMKKAGYSRPGSAGSSHNKKGSLVTILFVFYS